MNPTNKPVQLACQVCNAQDTDCLTSLSETSHVDYFRCRECGHVWSLPRPVLEPPCDHEPAER